MLGDTGDSWLPAPNSATQRVPAEPTPTEEVPEDLQDIGYPGDEDAPADDDFPDTDDRVEPYKLPPIWAREIVCDSGIEGLPPAWEEQDGPRRFHRLREQGSVGEFLHVNYGLMTRAMLDREPTDVGEALKQDVWRKAMELEIDAIERNGT